MGQMLRICFGFVVASAMLAQAPVAEAPSTYTLGPDDQISVRALDLEVEWPDKPLRLDPRGNINLPMIGRVRAAGLTQEELEAAITAKLKAYVKEPQVTVTVMEFRSQPVSILGAVTTPGVHQLQGRKTLFEMISMAGGLKPDAGYQIKITRRLEWGKIPLPSAKEDGSGQFSVADVAVKEIMKGENPEQNIQIKPNDVISVPKAELIYVIGAVKKAGGYILGEKKTVSALQVLSLAEGLDRNAAAKSAKIMRQVKGSEDRLEIAVDLKKILAGKGGDVALQAEDILFVPVSTAKVVGARTIDAMVGMSSAALYRIP